MIAKLPAPSRSPLPVQALIAKSQIETIIGGAIRLQLVLLPSILITALDEPSSCHHPFHLDHGAEVVASVAACGVRQGAIAQVNRRSRQGQALREVPLILELQLIDDINAAAA